MSDLIKTIIETREIASQIAVQSLIDMDGISEVDLRDKIFSQTSKYDNLFPKGWYDPPAGGVGILFDKEPFKRLQFDSLRNSESWPNESSKFEKETVGIVYLSPVDKKTGMIGDIGFTIYNGESEEIKQHIKKCFNTTLAVAEHAQVGMKFSELYEFAMKQFTNEVKIIGWMTTTSDPLKGINLGHTVPGSYTGDFSPSESFNEVKKEITTKRIYINIAESFEIPETCAFTVEARLADDNKPHLPNVFFHFIVTFSKGEKKILKNFEDIFKIAKMDYI